jgi:hypothetical protein
LGQLARVPLGVGAWIGYPNDSGDPSRPGRIRVVP